MEPGEKIWEGRIGSTMLRVGVPHQGRIIAEWDTPGGSRQKTADSVEQFERTVLFQLLLTAGETDQQATQEVVAAIEKAEAERPRRPEPEARPRRRNPKVRQHRRSRRPPRRI